MIKKPLEKLGINPEEIFDFESYNAVNEIHDLSGGRPYEIQLICHFLFRRVQDKRAKKMSLDLSVLEDIRRELETSQDITVRPILVKIRTLKKSRLLALGLLCACDGCATFDQIWAIEYILNSNKYWTKKSLEEELLYFISEGVISKKEDIINFAGDDFDKIYAKYFAKEQRVPLSFSKFPLEIFLDIRVRNFLKNIKDLNSISGIFTSDVDINLKTIPSRMTSEEDDKDIFVEGPLILNDLYFLMIDYRERDTLPLLQIKIILPWLKKYVTGSLFQTSFFSASTF